MQNLPNILIQLLKGIIYRDKHEKTWHDLLHLQPAVREYIGVIGLELYLDEAEGYAFVRQHEAEDTLEDDTKQRLVQRRAMSYSASLLCVLLRKKLIEQDTQESDSRIILSKDQLLDMMQIYMPASSNEARTIEKIAAAIQKIVDIGFLRQLPRQLPNDQDKYELRRIIKAFVDANWLGDIKNKLEEYQDYANRTS